ncbi:serine/threonine-protein kinase [Streptomyces sp. NPDC006129]|uniref:serine/threonine-protein kinase n=1 Tax=Streptomyces sp. NPDC006129 TaxID=3155348 RepID=UPI0033BB70BB
MALRDSDPAEVGGYRIEDRLGSGGMGVVYLARSASGRRLAVKVVHGQYADDDEFRTRFRREVAAARRVSGAFTAPVVDADADAPRPWMATLYIPGADLGTHVREHGPLPLPRLRELAAGLTEALRDIHRVGVVHRDLKPANVMLAEDGPRVIDFGISRAAEFAASDALTQTGRVMGTPPFMSPEQFASPQDVGPAADIFSLGSVLTYAATRRGPFDSPSPYETALRVVEGDPDLSGVPDELLPLVSVCLKKHPKSRATPDELLALLRDGLAQAGPRPSPDGGGARNETTYDTGRPRTGTADGSATPHAPSPTGTDNQIHPDERTGRGHDGAHGQATPHTRGLPTGPDQPTGRDHDHTHGQAAPHTTPPTGTNNPSHPDHPTGRDHNRTPGSAAREAAGRAGVGESAEAPDGRAGRGRKGTPLRGTDMPSGTRKRGGLGAWARRWAGGRGEQTAAGREAYGDEPADVVAERPVLTPAVPETWPDPAALLLTALGPGPRLCRTPSAVTISNAST